MPGAIVAMERSQRTCVEDREQHVEQHSHHQQRTHRLLSPARELRRRQCVLGAASREAPTTSSRLAA